MSAGKDRYGLLDVLRGLCVISMTAYHAMYDVVFVLGRPVSWYTALPGYIWQQSICWTFILLSGFCWKLSHRPLRRGLILVGCGAVITLATWLVMPSQLIQYGVLTLLGLSALLVIPLDRLAEKLRLPPGIGLSASLLLFFLTRGVPARYLGFEGLRLLRLPDALYGSDLFAVLGFHGPGFVSSDYFPLIPWFFLFAAGCFLWGVLSPHKAVKTFLRGRELPVLRPFAFIGRHSLLIYLLHQPLLMLLFLPLRSLS